MGATYTVIGAAVLVGQEWWWIEDYGPRDDTYLCVRAWTNQRKLFHYEDFQEVI